MFNDTDHDCVKSRPEKWGINILTYTCGRRSPFASPSGSGSVRPRPSVNKPLRAFPLISKTDDCLFEYDHTRALGDHS